MRRVLYALVPSVCVYVWYFGPGLLINLAIASVAALGVEALILRHRSADGPGPGDGSALVTAALLSLALPPLVPWWIPAIGGAVAIAIGKHVFGGLGRNIFNPAMVAWAGLLISFPVEMTQWIPPQFGDLDYAPLSLFETLAYSLAGILPSGTDIDALTRATPLDLLREGLRNARMIPEIRAGALFGDFGGRGWEWVANMTALGGAYLLFTGTIRWHIPFAVLAGLLIPATVLYGVDASRFASPGVHLFSGATMLGAFFIATDPVTAATSIRGRLIFGAGIGMLTYVIRTWGGYPDGMAFAILIMNAAAPIIDRYTRPIVYGH
ncbi:MAG: RnfABCDGE type electron transport complex subunit D [Gammaproteobacteria bacterium]|jgi:electron transport complex protein RnfD